MWISQNRRWVCPGGGLLAHWKFLLVVLVVKLLQVSQKQRGLQVKWPGSSSVAKWAHMFNKNHLMEP